MTLSPWAGAKLSLHLSCVTKWASPKNRPARCKSLLQTVVCPCPFNLSLSKSTAERVWLCHAYPRQSSATWARCLRQEQQVVPLPPTSPAAEGASLMLVPKRRIQGEDNYFVITIWVLPSIQTPLITVNGIEKGSNKSELVRHRPSPPQGLQIHSWYDVEANKQSTQTRADRYPMLIIYAMLPEGMTTLFFSILLLILIKYSNRKQQAEVARRNLIIF